MTGYFRDFWFNQKFASDKTELRHFESKGPAPKKYYSNVVIFQCLIAYDDIDFGS